MNTGSNTGANEPIEFMIIDIKGDGFNRFAWFHDETKLGADKDLESILNDLGGKGWDVVQFIPNTRILLRRKAR